MNFFGKPVSFLVDPPSHAVDVPRLQHTNPPRRDVLRPQKHRSGPAKDNPERCRPAPLRPCVVPPLDH